jgi:hypothetical protein
MQTVLAYISKQRCNDGITKCCTFRMSIHVASPLRISTLLSDRLAGPTVLTQSAQ